jgi:hypothetical protein
MHGGEVHLPRETRAGVRAEGGFALLAVLLGGDEPAAEDFVLSA